MSETGKISEALKGMRLSCCQLGDFMYEPVRFCSQEIVKALDAALPLAEKLEAEQGWASSELRVVVSDLKEIKAGIKTIAAERDSLRAELERLNCWRIRRKKMGKMIPPEIIWVGTGGCMNVDEFKTKVIDLFKSGNATEEQWQEMGNAVLYVSERDYENVPEIVESIDPELPQ